MTESEHTGELVKELREHIRTSGVVWKHHDSSTSGIPDLSVSHRGRSIWLEAKRIDAVERLKRCAAGPGGGYCVEIFPRIDVPPLQWEMLRRTGCGYLLFYTMVGDAMTHVNGYRGSVRILRLRVYPMEKIARQIMDIVRGNAQ